MKKTIFLKTFRTGTLILISAVALITVFTFASLKRWHKNDLQNHLQRLGLSLQPTVIEKLAKEPGVLDAWAKQMGKSINARISVILPGGSVLADSKAMPDNMDNHLDRPEISEAMAGDASSRQRFSRTIMADTLYIALPLQLESEIAGVLRISMTMESIRNLRHELEVRVTAILLSLFPLSLLLTYIHSRRISRPIQSLAQAARIVAEGDFTPRVYVSDGGELGELATSFNRMVGRQSDMINEMAQQRKQLETIFAAMREALAVITHDGTVLMSNLSFNKLVDDESPTGKKYWEVLRSSEFYQTIQSLIAAPRNHSREMESADRNYLVNFTLLPGTGDFVVTFLDITERRRLETMKRDFVGNVSHELKTPLTSIKGFLEVLEAEVRGSEGLRYLEIIRRNADRMIHIIQDLLLLSRMEDKSFSLNTREVSLSQLVRDTARMFETAVHRKGLKLTLDLCDKMSPINGDSSRLEDMLVNLLDNAVKYTESGGITVRLKAEASHVVLEVSDTGIGIPADLQERVFERFFVADASRSKENGGTGLGLSIVKHIVMLHEGEISINSTPHHGTTFTVRLPLAPSS